MSVTLGQLPRETIRVLLYSREKSMVLYTTEKRNDMKEGIIMIYKNFMGDQIFFHIREVRLEWLGHVWRADNQIIKRVLVAEMKGKRPLGKPRTRWRDSVIEGSKNTTKRSSDRHGV